MYAAVCTALRDALGEDVLASVYVADEERLWLTAQRGYDQVVHTHSPGAGLYSRAFAEGRALAVGRAVASDPAYIEVVRGIESLAAAPFSCQVAGIVGIETRERTDEETRSPSSRLRRVRSSARSDGASRTGPARERAPPAAARGQRPRDLR